AGAGKTALLQAAVQLRDQRPLLTVTPTLKAAQEARSAGSDACSLQSCSMLMATGGTTTTSGTNWPQEKQTQPLAKRFTHHDQTAHITCPVPPSSWSMKPAC